MTSVSSQESPVGDMGGMSSMRPSLNSFQVFLTYLLVGVANGDDGVLDNLLE